MRITPEDFEAFTAAYTAAWNSGKPEEVARHYTDAGAIAINRGDDHAGTAAMTAMAAGFMNDFPDLKLTCDFIRIAGDHGVFGWTLEGHHAETGNLVKASGWEEWEMSEDGRVARSLGWFDAFDYDRQVQNGQG